MSTQLDSRLLVVLIDNKKNRRSNFGEEVRLSLAKARLAAAGPVLIDPNAWPAQLPSPAPCTTPPRGLAPPKFSHVLALVHWTDAQEWHGCRIWDFILGRQEEIPKKQNEGDEKGKPNLAGQLPAARDNWIIVAFGGGGGEAIGIEGPNELWEDWREADTHPLLNEERGLAYVRANSVPIYRIRKVIDHGKELLPGQLQELLRFATRSKDERLGAELPTCVRPRPKHSAVIGLLATGYLAARYPTLVAVPEELVGRAGEHAEFVRSVEYWKAAEEATKAAPNREKDASSTTAGRITKSPMAPPIPPLGGQLPGAVRTKVEATASQGAETREDAGPRALLHSVEALDRLVGMELKRHGEAAYLPAQPRELLRANETWPLQPREAGPGTKQRVPDKDVPTKPLRLGDDDLDSAVFNLWLRVRWLAECSE